MAITVETGAVVTGANSYVTVAFADAYFAIDNNYATVWAALTTDGKEGKLKWATRILDQKVQWKGNKTTDTSALRWPRTGVFNRDGIVVAVNEIPLQLQEVTCEMAKFLATVDPTTSQGGDALKRISVDVIDIEYQDNVVQPEAPPILNQLLRGLGFYPVVGGHQFVRIVKA